MSDIMYLGLVALGFVIIEVILIFLKKLYLKLGGNISFIKIIIAIIEIIIAIIIVLFARFLSL